MKAQFAVLALAMAGALAAYLFYEPGSRQAHVDPAPQVADAQPAPEIPAAPQPRPPPVDPIEPLATDIVIPPDAGVVDAAPTGPFTIDLGRHSVHLRDKPWVLHLHLKLVTPKYVTRTEIVRARRTLVRMIFFLVSHRTKSGSEGAEGQARFEADLLERMRNVIKTGPIDALVVERYEIAEYVPPDAGAE